MFREPGQTCLLCGEQRTRVRRFRLKRERPDSMDGAVRMEAVQRGGLWEIAAVKKARSFLAVKGGPVQTGRRAKEAARKPQVIVVEKQEEVKPVKLIEVDLNSDDEKEMEMEKHGAAEDVGATAAEDVGATAAEGVGADLD